MPSLAWTLVVLTAINLATAVPTPWDPNNAFSGSGGHATGGSVNDESTDALTKLLGALRINVDSNNGGRGGYGTSGLSSTTAASRVTRREKGMAAYSGTGGAADGGSFSGVLGLVNLWSNNGGDAGTADSGSSLEGVRARRNEIETMH